MSAQIKTVQNVMDLTVGEFVEVLRGELKDRRVSAYDLALTLLSLLAPDADHAYQVAPHMCNKTLRRIYSQGVLMGMGIISPSKNHIHVDTLKEEELETLQALATEARVAGRQALTAVLRYGNPLERVVKVLADIRALVKHGTPPRNATGLFVHTMRHGTDVRLPGVALAAREAVSAPDAPAPLTVGVWVKWNLAWHQVTAMTGVSALLALAGDVMDAYKVPLDTVARLPRRETALG